MIAHIILSVCDVAHTIGEVTFKASPMIGTATGHLRYAIGHSAQDKGMLGTNVWAI